MSVRDALRPSSRPALTLLVALLAVLTAGSAAAQSPVVGSDIYVPRRSDGATVTSGTSGLCIGCRVLDPAAVTSDTLSGAAAIETPLGVLGSAWLAVTFPVAQPAGRYAGFALSSSSGALNVQLLSAITLTTYADGQPRQSATGSALLTLGLLDTSGLRSVDMLASEPFDEIRITVGAAASVLARTNVAYAFSSATAGPGVVAGGLSVGGGLLGSCAGCSLLNPGAVIDADLTNRAALVVAPGASGSAYLDVSLAVQAGPLTVGFVIDSGLSDDDLRAAVQLGTFLNGTQVETSTAATLRIRALGGGLRVVEFEATAALDEVRIRLSALPGGGGAQILVASVSVAGVTTAGEGDAPGVATAELLAATPNPMQSSATIGLRLATGETVRVALYDALGRRVAVLHDGPLAAGMTEFRIGRAGLAAGVYVYRADGSTFALARRLTVLR